MNNMINTKNYRLVEQNTKDNSKNLIKVTQKGKPMNYALYACKQLYNKKQEVVVIQGMGQASSKVISTVEFMRKRVPELHVAYEIGSLESSRVYESLQGEHDRVTTTKNIPFLSAHVTLSSPDQVKDMVGYMKPLPEGELLQQEKFRDQIDQYEPKERPELPPQQQHEKQMRGQRPKHHYKKYKNNMHENKHYGVKGQHNNPKGYQRTKQPKMTTGDNERNNNQGNRYNNSNNRDGNRNQRGGYRGSRGYRGGRGGRGNRGHRGGRGGRGRYNRNENGN